MQSSKFQFTIMIFFLWLYNVRKGNGLNCSTGNPPLWESPTKRCTFHFNWDCSMSKGEAVCLKNWVKDDTEIAHCKRASNFTTNDGFHGRLEQYKENGFILKDVTPKDAGFYKIVVLLNDTNEIVHSNPIYLPSITSCDPDLIEIYNGYNANHLTGGNDTSHVSLCDGGRIPTFMFCLLAAMGIIIIFLFSTIMCLWRKYNFSQNDLRETHNLRRGELKFYLTLPDVHCDTYAVKLPKHFFTSGCVTTLSIASL